MSHTACIRFAPVFTSERLAAGVRPGRELYQRGSLKFLPGRETVPLLVNHEDDRQIGIVHEIVEWPLVDGPWYVARATVSDAPEWLKLGTKASFRLSTYRREEVNDWTRIFGALVSEVSVLSPAVRPAEPLAEVVLLQRSPAGSPPVPAGAAPHTGDVIAGNGQLIRRPIGQVLGVR